MYNSNLMHIYTLLVTDVLVGQHTHTHTQIHTCVQNIQIRTMMFKMNKGSQLCQMKSSSQNSDPLKKAKKLTL